MSEAQRLLAEATSLPWYQTEEFIPADAALIVYAVNHLPAYEAAVEALEQIIKTDPYHTAAYTDNDFLDAIRQGSAALRRLREDPA